MSDATLTKVFRKTMINGVFTKNIKDGKTEERKQMVSVGNTTSTSPDNGYR